MLEKYLNGKRIVLLFIVTNLVYVYMLAATIPRTMAFAGGMKLLDMMPTGYSAKYVRELLAALGEQGRSVYLGSQIPIDMLYPGLFAITYCLVIAYLLRAVDLFHSRYLYLCWLPVIAGLADYMENFGIIGLLVNYPTVADCLVNLTCFFSVVKSFATTLSFIVLLVTLVWVGIKSWPKK